VLGELLRTDGEGDGQDSGHGNGDTTNQEDEDVVETATVIVTEAGIQAENLCNDENTDDNKTKRTDLGENLLEMASGLVILSDERSGTTEESVGTGGNDNALGFTLFASGATTRELINMYKMK